MRAIIFDITEKLSGLLLLSTFITLSCTRSAENPFLGDGQQRFVVKSISEGERFPNVVVATDGSIIATWGPGLVGVY